MTDTQLCYTIGVTLIKGVGPILAKNLIAYVGDAETVFHTKQQQLEKIPGVGPQIAAEIVKSADVLRRAEKELEFIKKHTVRAYCYSDKEYPYRLKECVDAPVILYVSGNCNFNSGRFIAFVGTRNATDYGRTFCETIIEELSQQLSDITIVSGLAYGIDVTAHKAALKNQLPTVGVVAHGLDRIYPATHRSVAEKMLHDGAVVSEYITGTEPDKPNFVQRNRIIAGICDAVAIVESAVRGGALLTADAANQYNRDVFAVPGRVGDVHSAGCNELIRQNKAALIASANDILQAMNWQPQEQGSAVQTLLFNDLDPDEQEIITLLRQHDTLQINQLTLQLKLPVEKLFSLLLQMEFKGYVRCLPGNVYKVVK